MGCVAGSAVQVYAAGSGRHEEAVLHTTSQHARLIARFTDAFAVYRYPEELADRSWDNVGLLVANNESQGKKARVLVTNDLTYQVAMDAIEQDVSVIVSYRKCQCYNRIQREL